MDEKSLKCFMTPKRLHTIFEHAGSKYEIEVGTPDLADAKRSAWGAWGPVYAFEFEEPRSVSVTYRRVADALEGRFEIPVQKIYLDSPMLREDRESNPLYLRFRDAVRGIAFEGYLDGHGNPDRLEIKQLPGTRQAAALLLLKPPTQDAFGGASMDMVA